jgi:hypothetical protein
VTADDDDSRLRGHVETYPTPLDAIARELA